MNFLSPLAPIVHWGMRLSVAATFIYHAIGKIPPTGFAEATGMPLLIGWLVVIAEIGGGAALVIGGLSKDWITRLGGLCVMVIMIGAIALVHWDDGWSGMEFQVLLLTVGIYFAARGNQT